MKKTACSVILIAAIASVLFQQSCAHEMGNRELASPDARIFNKPYDEVWEAVKEVIFVDLGCFEKEMNKKKGLIETTWVSRITTDGTLRWRIKATLQKRKDSTLVAISKEVQILDELRKSIKKYKEEAAKGDDHTASWRNTHEDLSALGEIYQGLENKLKD